MRYRFLFQVRFYLYLVYSCASWLCFHINRYHRRKPLPPRLRRLIWRSDLELSDPNRVYLAQDVSLGRGVILGVPAGLPPTDEAKIVINDRVYLEENVELGVTPGALLSIGENTSIHRGCVLLGNVQIGRNCVFSYNIYIAAGTHVVTAQPTWLIKDQDDAYLPHQPRERVIVEDDVWIGWGVFVKSGVYIGRGAVIGANSVVTGDIEPYALYAGAPARKIGQRLSFAPPSEILAQTDETLPYFYAGFLDDQRSLEQSRRRGVIWAHDEAWAILAGKGDWLVVEGSLADTGDSVTLSVNVNNRRVQEQVLQPGPFTLTFSIDPMDRSLAVGLAACLRSYTHVRFVHTPTKVPTLGIRRIAIADQDPRHE